MASDTSVASSLAVRAWDGCALPSFLALFLLYLMRAAWPFCLKSVIKLSISVWFCSVARSIGDFSSMSLILISAPYFRRIARASVWPLSTASWAGVAWIRSMTFTYSGWDWHLLSRYSRMPMCPSPAAMCSGVAPSAVDCMILPGPNFDTRYWTVSSWLAWVAAWMVHFLCSSIAIGSTPTSLMRYLRAWIFPSCAAKYTGLVLCTSSDSAIAFPHFFTSTLSIFTLPVKAAKWTGRFPWALGTLATFG